MKTTSTLLRLCLLFLLFISFSSGLLAEDDFAGLFCPQDVYVDCEDELWDLSIYGNAYYKDYSGTHDAGEPYVKYYLNTCNTGYITRTWSVRLYGLDYSCYQTIHVGGGGSISYNDIDWPDKNVYLTGCSPNLDPYDSYDGYPQWGYRDCSLLAMSYRDNYFKISGTCNKIIREWTVLDWCVYDPYRNPRKGIYKYYQTIKIADTDLPEFTCPGDIEVNSYNCVDAEVVADPLVIDPTTCGGEYTITNNSPYAVGSGNDISGTYPIGVTKVKYTIRYGCGEIKTCTVHVKVRDAKAPTPYCYAYMAVSLMGIDSDEDGLNDEGMAEVWAKDLDVGSYAHCVDGPLKYSFSADTADNVRVFTCAEVGENEVQMWVTDALGNQSWCLVILDVQNNSANIQECTGEDAADDGENTSARFTLEGRVSNIYGDVVPEVEIMMADTDGEMLINNRTDTSYLTTYDTIFKDNGTMLIRHLQETIIEEVIDTIMDYKPVYKKTGESGEYAFEAMALANASYMIEATGSRVIDAEVSIEDIEVLFDHLTRISPFTSPYQYIAADVDGDGKVAYLDLRHMLMYYSGKATSLQIGKKAVYIDASLNYDNPEDVLLEDRYSTIAVDVIDKDMSGLDFVEVIIGDLSNSENFRMPDSRRSTSVFNTEIQYTDDTQLINAVKILLGSGADVKPLVYPNPFDHSVTMEFNSLVRQQTTIHIFSIDGKLVYNQPIMLEAGINQVDMDLKDEESGLYYYLMTIDERNFSGKLIKR